MMIVSSLDTPLTGAPMAAAASKEAPAVAASKEAPRIADVRAPTGEDVGDGRRISGFRMEKSGKMRGKESESFKEDSSGGQR